MKVMCRIFGHDWTDGGGFLVAEVGGPYTHERDVCRRSGCKEKTDWFPYRGNTWRIR